MASAATSYVRGHEYVIDEAGTKGVWTGKGFVSPEDFLKSKGQGQTQFDDKRALMDRIERAKAKTNPFSTGYIGGATAWIPGSPASSLQADLAPLQANEFISGTLEVRQNSPTGAGVGGQSDAEGKRFEGRTMSFDVGQPTSDMRYGLNALEKAYGRHTPGLTQANPFELTQENRQEIPQGAYFRAADGETYRNERGAGFPVQLTEKNRHAIPQGAYFRAADGKVYRNQRGAGFPGRGGQSSKPAKASGGVIQYDAQGNRIR